jgi:TRAP-type mannitol/chloroaromatic compound transport system permease large subunit
MVRLPVPDHPGNREGRRDNFSGAPPEIELKHMYTGIWPFIALQALATALVVAFPQTVLWLPNAMR